MNKYLLFKDKSLKTNINIIILIMIFSGIFGFIYETIFYKIDLGYFVKRGSTYGPWIPIYVYGGLLITLLSYRFKDNKFLVFSLGLIISGVLEYTVGFYLDKYMNLKLWDYSNEILNFGNINGYICLRSVLFFGISSLFLVYFIIPKIVKISTKYKENTLTIITRVLLIIYFVDVITYYIVN